ncbi:putative Ig domain-containing protein, partial [Cellulomonas triticagri]|uniref:putative Ig domain-containing protein n=1 Tax=Cellulomonas triticagri TaxID=2483352 RepID=UPI0018F6C44B
TGLLSGTPTASGAFTFDLTATNGTTPSARGSFEILVTAPPNLAPDDPPAGVVGQPYEHTFTTDGDPAPQVHVTSGALPDGLNLDADTGLLSGTPTASGTFAFALTATNGTAPQATADFRILVADAPTQAWIEAGADTGSAVTGQQVSVTGGGFAAGERVTFTATGTSRTAPLLLGQADAEPGGAVTFAFIAPAPGDYTLTATSPSSTATTTLTVQPSPAPIPRPDATVTPSPTPAPGTADPDAHGEQEPPTHDSLPVTGTRAPATALVALGLLTTGAATFWWRHRTRAT